MALIQEADKGPIRERLNELESEVSLINFSQELECMWCRETRQLLEELSELSDKVKIQAYNFQVNKSESETYKIDKIPATVIKNEKDHGIRFFGIPSGYEFSTLLEDMIMVSRGESGLSERSKKLIQQIDKPIHIQVYVTPTCPYCPKAVLLAHQIALESEFVTADMVEASEFPHLSQKYNVMGVPKTIVNETISFEGAVPEDMFVQRVLDALK